MRIYRLGQLLVCEQGGKVIVVGKCHG